MQITYIIKCQHHTLEPTSMSSQLLSHLYVHVLNSIHFLTDEYNTKFVKKIKLPCMGQQVLITLNKIPQLYINLIDMKDSAELKCRRSAQVTT